MFQAAPAAAQHRRLPGGDRLHRLSLPPDWRRLFVVGLVVVQQLPVALPLRQPETRVRLRARARHNGDIADKLMVADATHSYAYKCNTSTGWQLLLTDKILLTRILETGRQWSIRVKQYLVREQNGRPLIGAEVVVFLQLFESLKLLSLFCMYRYWIPSPSIPSPTIHFYGQPFKRNNVPLSSRVDLPFLEVPLTFWNFIWPPFQFFGNVPKRNWTLWRHDPAVPLIPLARTKPEQAQPCPTSPVSVS